MQTQLPKAILHEHIEGSVTPEMAVILAKKYGVRLPENFIYPKGQYQASEFPNGRYRYDEADFNAFVTTYDVVAELVREPEDYYLIMKDFLSRNAAKGLCYCEIITSAFHLCYIEKADGSGGLDQHKYHQIIDAVERAIDEVKTQFDIEVRLQACGVRHLSAEHLKLSTDFIIQQPRDIITGFNIAGDERAGEFADFTDIHQQVAQIPLKKSYHAGEICGPESIRQALKYGAVRIGHGIAAIEDPALIKTLIDDNITLEISITSNLILVPWVEHSFDKHPIRKLYDKGVRVCINTDDAGIFGTDIGKEYDIAAREYGFITVELLDLTLCALEAAFVDPAIKKSLIDKVYRQFSEQDWAELARHCSTLPQGALKQRLSARLDQRH